MTIKTNISESTYEISDEIIIQNLARPSHPLPSPVRINCRVWLQADATPSKLDNDTSNVARILGFVTYE